MSTDPIPIRFYDGYRPDLFAGDYTLTAVQQTVSTDPAHPLSDTSHASQAFSVAAPRFALDSAEVQSFYPPANQSGQYDYKLPNIVLTERALPWERELADDFPKPPIPNAPAYPWLALLVLETDDILLPAGTAAPTGPNPTRVGSYAVSDFMNPSDPSVLHTNLSPQREDEKNCHAIDISTQTFTRLVPRLADLPWLAHVRQVDVASKAGANAAGSGWFSVVVANRFPVTTDPAGTDFIAHLVSLEGLASYLVDSPAWPSGVTTVRLASLASWTFTSQPVGLDFAALMTNLVAGQSAGGDGLRLRLPQPGPQTAGTPAADAAAALSQGYAALHYETRVGDQTYAWYHGPLVPYPVPAIAAGTAFASSTAATIYDPGSGTFDLSYAACWEVGRLLALRDRAYATAQVRSQTALRRTLNLVRERSLQTAALPDPKAVSRSFAGWLATEAAASVPKPGGQAAAPQPSQPSSARPPAAPLVQLQALHASSHVGAMVEAHVTAAAAVSGPVASVADWLGRLRLLENVPFVHLVPDARMLPRESIRFFYVDANALDALCDGAQSIGIQTSRDAAQQQLVRPAMLQAAVASSQAIRPNLIGQSVPADAPASDPVAGFLLRSAAVSGWPGLEVKAWADLAGTQPIDPLRLDHLAADVLIGLYPQVPVRIDVEEPKEGIAFGVEDEWKVDLRYIDGASVGQEIPNVNVTLDESFRPGGVLQVDSWQQHLIGLDALKGAVATWGPAGFALQMISSPEQMMFDNGGAA